MRVPGNPLGRAVEAAALGPEYARRAATLVPRVGTLLDTAECLLARLDALLTRFEQDEGVLRTTVEKATASEAEIRELLPVLSSLRTAAPDLTELVGLSRGLNEIIGALPGLGKAKRRVDEKLEDAEAKRDQVQ
ncbi:hypothetical protein [uncultured Jatrophihabitans sp.]|uniref:hypothetical protein n=1 Tax=uncultured Jatrophihabitans sp. TaxID=1610747 RepID=UPI0035C9A68C